MTEAHQEHIWIVALYEQETRANELLDRLNAIGVDTSEATTLRVEINDQIRAAKFTSIETPFSYTARSLVTGAVIGGAIAVFLGIIFYLGGFLVLSFAPGMFNHAIVSLICGAVLGALAGALLGGARQRKMGMMPMDHIQHVKSDGYLVTVRMPPQLGEQAEEIARGLGAKQILL